MSSIRQPSRLELTRLTSVAEKLSGAWQHLSAQEVLSEILTGNALLKTQRWCRVLVLTVPCFYIWRVRSTPMRKSSF